MVEIKIIEDPQAPLHVGARRLPDWLRNKKGLFVGTGYVRSFRCLTGHRGADRGFNIRQSRELAESFFANHPVRGRRTYKGHFPLIENHFKHRIAGYEVDEEGTFSLNYLPSRFDKIRVPQMNIGIYQDHAFLITNLETTMRVPRVKQDWHKLAVCGGPQRFAQEGQPSWCAKESKSRSPRRRKKTRLTEEGLCSKGGKLDGARVPAEGCVYRSQNVLSRWERVFAGYRMDRFCPETNTVFQFRGCHWLGCPDCF